MKTAIIAIPLIMASVTFAMDPPGVMWELTYGSAFYDVKETSGGDYVVAGRRWSDYARTVFLYSPSGELLWEYSSYPVSLVNYSILELPDGSFVAVGHGTAEPGGTPTSLSIQKISAEGDSVWTRLYELPDNCRGYANTVISLPVSMALQFSPVASVEFSPPQLLTSGSSTLISPAFSFSFSL